MARIDKISKSLKEGEKKQAKKEEVKKQKDILQNEDADSEAISKIVDRMKDKYIKEGVLKEGDDEKTKLKMMMLGERNKIGAGASVSELQLYESPIIKMLGKFYLLFEMPMSAISKYFNTRFGTKLENDLLSSGMAFSVEQYLALSITGTVFGTLVVLLLTAFLFAAEKIPLIAMLLLILLSPLFIMFVALSIPSGKAKKIGFAIDKELPFALRHMSIEVRAGVGIFRVMESIATSGYGALSEGFKWVLLQIEKGVATEDALEAWSARTRSDSLNRVVSHLVRALRTGGNLSDIMITIAEDVSFERKSRIADFAEKLNLLGLFFMMSTVVFPVMITILVTIASSPSISSMMGALSLFNFNFLLLVYFIIVPSLVGIFIYFIKSSDPG